MFNEPIFQTSILEKIYNNFKHYFFEGIYFYEDKVNLIYVILAVFIFLYLNYFAVKYKQTVTYPNLFPDKKIFFNIKNFSNPMSLAFLGISIAAYSINMFMLDDSLFNHYDLMGAGTMFVLKNGVTADVNELRFAPLAFFDINFVYAITHNFNLINVYIILKQLLISYLFYKLFNFIPVSKRLFTIGIINLMPTMFWLNNTVFPEQNLIIFVLLSFISIKKFSETNEYKYLGAFILFMNLAIYIKETTILLYLGILLSSLVYNLKIDNFGLKDILRPLKTIRRFPLEYMIFISLFVFWNLYLLMINQDENLYISFHKVSLLELMGIYKLELAINFTAILVLIYKLIKGKFSTSPLLSEGMLIGCTLITYVIIFHLSIAPFPAHKTYYLILPAIFCLWYIVQEASVKPLSLMFFVLAGYSAVINLQFYQREEGAYRRGMSEFFAKELEEKGSINIYFPIKNELEPDAWVIETFNTAYKYYFPDAKIKIKSNHRMNPLIQVAWHANGLIHEYEYANSYADGDYVVVHKDKGEIIDAEKIYENKIYKVYLIDNKNI